MSSEHESLIIKLGATGDVVRTTPLVRVLPGRVTWVTASKNRALVEGIAPNVRCVTWEEQSSVSGQTYDLLINLEDDQDTGEFAANLSAKRRFGAHFDRSTQRMSYTMDSSAWFDMSLISAFGREEANARKLKNRRTYQDLLFEGLGVPFSAQRYILPAATDTGLRGDVALAPVAGPVWPMKAWAYYDELRERLEAHGLVVNVLPQRKSLLEHLGDVQGHQCLVSGDSLPMHLALGSGVRCVSLFNCTSPWEIYGYGVQTQLVSPLLKEFFYVRSFDSRAITAIDCESVLAATLQSLQKATGS